jgi:toxin-antitoxin system PIN domain toxin
VFVVDANILVYAADDDSPDHDCCMRLLEQWRAGPAPWFLPWGVVFEFLRVVTHRRVLREPWTAERAWGFIVALLAGGSLRMLTARERYADVATEVVREVPNLRGNLWHDAETAILMREHGIRRIYTRDTDFHRFPFLEVVDPTR